jgi:hypothetical protein
MIDTLSVTFKYLQQLAVGVSYRRTTPARYAGGIFDDHDDDLLGDSNLLALSPSGTARFRLRTSIR